MKTKCPFCDTAYEVEDQYEGKLVNCENCKEEFYAMWEEAESKKQPFFDEKNVDKKTAFRKYANFEKQFELKGGFMYSNIGAKIKFLAQLFAWIGIIVSIISGFVWIVRGFYVGFKDGGVVLIGIGIGVMIGGFLASWISSWYAYGFGELIEKTTDVAKNTDDCKFFLRCIERKLKNEN